MLKLLMMTSITWSAVSFLMIGTLGFLLRRRDQVVLRNSRRGSTSLRSCSLPRGL